MILMSRYDNTEVLLIRQSLPVDVALLCEATGTWTYAWVDT